VTEHVLREAVQHCEQVWGRRLVAAYALGSLAHGGFSAHVSDVDLGLVLADPLQAEDEQAIERVVTAAKVSGRPLAERLSVFWGSPATLCGAASGGRFAPNDVLDLAQYGRLLAGQDVRARVRRPTLEELVVSSAEFALQRLSTPQTMAYLLDPAKLASADARTLTKLILFPVRFLFTARTGEAGMNDRSVEHFTAVEAGPAAELAAKAFGWRYAPPRPGERAVTAALRSGVLPLYRRFVGEYQDRLRGYGALELTQAYVDWLALLNPRAARPAPLRTYHRMGRKA
jgi:hypothetical protein